MNCKESGKDFTKETMSQTSIIQNQHETLMGSSLYQQFLAERKEILKHKWLKSEALGKDIGFEAALLDWIRNHRKAWRKAQRNIPESF